MTARAQTRAAKAAIPPQPIQWFGVKITGYMALPQAIPDKCPKCEADFTKGCHLEEINVTFFYVNVNKSGACGQDEVVGDDAYDPQMHVMGYRCDECKLQIVGSCGVDADH